MIESSSDNETAPPGQPCGGADALLGVSEVSKGRRSRQPFFYPFLVVLLCLLGAAVSGFLLQWHFLGSQSVLLAESACGGSDGGCAEVLNSRWSVLPPAAPVEAAPPRGFPVAALGLFYFTALGVWIVGGRSTAGPGAMVSVLVGISCLASLGWIALMAFSLDKWCPLCSFVHLINFSLFGVIVSWGRRGGSRTGNESGSKKSLRSSLRGVGVLGLVALLLCVAQWHVYEAIALKAVNAALVQEASDATRLELEFYELEKQVIELRSDDPVIEPSLPGTYSELVYWGDVACPHCLSFEGLLNDEVLPMFRGSLRVVYKHLPLRMHSQALPAAKALEAARLQGAFHGLSDAIKEHGHQRGEIDFSLMAEALGLDMSRFEKDMASTEVSERIQEDIRQFQSLNPSGTIPAVFLNGRHLTNRMRAIPGFWRTQADALKRARLAQGESWPEGGEFSDPRLQKSVVVTPEPSAVGNEEPSVAGLIGKPQIEVRNPIHQFGHVFSGSVVEHTFVVANIGTGLLEVRGVAPGEGVKASGTWEKRIKPGGVSRIPLQFDTSGLEGDLRVATYLKANVEDAEVPPLLFAGQASEGYDWTPQSVAFRPSGQGSDSNPVIIALRNSGADPISLVSAKVGGDSMKPVLRTIEKGRSYELELRMLESFSDEGLDDSVTILAENGARLIIKATAQSTRRLWARPASLRLPPKEEMKGVATEVVTIRSKDGEPFELSNVRFRQVGEQTIADLADVNGLTIVPKVTSAEGRSVWRIEVEFPPGFELGEGVRYGLISMDGKLPVNEELSIPVLQLKP